MHAGRQRYTVSGEASSQSVSIQDYLSTVKGAGRRSRFTGDYCISGHPAISESSGLTPYA